jgi:hypothetical protein
MTRFTILLCSTILSGCQTIPPGWAPSPPPRPQPPPLSLFEKTTADPDAIKQAVLRHIPPGTPIEQAQVMLEYQDFTCHPDTKDKLFSGSGDLIPPGVYLPGDVQKRLLQERDRHPIYCRATRHDLEEWHLKSFTVLVILIPDDAHRLRDVEVGLAPGPQRHTCSTFFKQRPTLHEPLGLPIEAARSQMTAAGFRCSDVRTGEPGQDPRPFIHCEAFDEELLGGHIVRVRLYLDESGLICESKVLNEGSPLDAERCMWLHGDESAAQAFGKAAIYPVRLGCRYTLITIAVTMAVTIWAVARR